MDPLEASVLGTKEVAVPVTFGILTTIAAFVPLSHVSGGWGDFAKQIPPVVIPVLLYHLEPQGGIGSCRFGRWTSERERFLEDFEILEDNSVLAGFALFDGKSLF